MKAVPRNGLVMLAVLPVIPAAAAPFTPAAPPMVLALALLAVTVALADLLASLGQRERVRASLPELVRLFRNREQDLPVTVTIGADGPRRVRIGLVLPADLVSTKEETRIRLADGQESGVAEWPCYPRRRGSFPVGEVHWEIPSRFGLWGLRGVSAVSCEVRVYPNLAEERRNVAALFLNRGQFGLHRHRQVGRGREFERLREYLPGDSYDEIHWKATARRGVPITKVFQVERTQEVYVIIDASRLSARVPTVAGEGTGNGRRLPDTVLERYVTASLLLGVAAERQGDHFGLLSYTDKVGRFLRASSGPAHFNACRELLHTLSPEPVSPDLAEVFSFLKLRLRRRALLVFLTALDDPVLEEAFERHIGLLTRQHVVLVNMVLPDGVGPLFDAGRPPPGHLDDVYAALGGHLRWRELREAGKKLRRRGATFTLLENEKLMAQLVSQYIDIKQRQLI